MTDPPGTEPPGTEPPEPEPPQPEPARRPPGSVTLAGVAVWVGGALSLPMALLVTAGSELREAEFGTRGLGWWLVGAVLAHLVLALAGLVALRAGRARWVLVVACAVGLAGAVVVVVETLVDSRILAILLAAASAVALAAVLAPSAAEWVREGRAAAD